MAYPSVTHTFISSTTASASAVNQNFSDLINSLSDGSKDININAATLAGNLIVNGNTTLGNASSDDLTLTASLASALSIKTNNTYDIGSAGLGLSGLYFGAPSSRSTRITANQSLSASHTLVLPNGNGTADDLLNTDGSGNLFWGAFRKLPNRAYNYSLSCAVGSNALTITLKGDDGNDLSSTNKALFSFRHATITTGTPVFVSASSNLTLTISSGSTLGHASSTEQYIYVYAINNSGTVELAATTVWLDDGDIVSTTAEGGAGAADSNSTVYSTTARSNVAFILLGRLDSNQSTAGTWAAVPTRIALGQNVLKPLSFSAYKTSRQTGISSATVTVDTKRYDTCNGLDLSTETFTVPKTGKWLFGNYIEGFSFSTTTQFYLTTYKNGGALRRVGMLTCTSGSDWAINGTTTDQFTKGDTVYFVAGMGSGTCSLEQGDNSSSFWGYYIGPN